MKPNSFRRTFTIVMAFISVASLSVFLSTSLSPVSAQKISATGEDENDFVFSGNCQNGEPYRLFYSSKVVDGQIYPFYEYEGPAGKGSVSTRATPRTMFVRVCTKLAEIIDDH